METNQVKLLKRATPFDCVFIILVTGIISSGIFWLCKMWSSTPPPPPLFLAAISVVALFLVGVIFPTKKGFGAWYHLSTTIGYTIALATVCTAPASEFFFSFVILLLGVSLGESIGIWHLKRKGYAEAPKKDHEPYVSLVWDDEQNS